MSAFTDAEIEFVNSQRLGRLATVGAGGMPHVMPVAVFYDPDAALYLAEADYGESFNIGTGRKTTIGEVAARSRELFGIASEPSFTMPERSWDVQDWYANPEKARTRAVR